LKEVNGQYELTGPLTSLTIPATLQDSLMARLDRLVTAKGLAQQASVIGRQFSYELLQAVSQLDEMTLQRELSRLVEAELVYQRGLPPQTVYMFKHALVQDSAYQSLLKSTRQQYHQRIALVLEEQFAETAKAQPELLAYHATEAGLNEQAVGYWQRAGEQAIHRSANVEAITHLTKGLELLSTLPDTLVRTQQELNIQTLLGQALMATKGQAAPEVVRTYARARELCQQLGEAPQLFPVLWGLWRFYLQRAELQTAHELGKQLLISAQRVQDSALLLEAHLALGATLLWRGEVASYAHLQQAMVLSQASQHRSLAFLYGQDPRVTCLLYVAWSQWVGGHPHQASQSIHQALALAQELSHTHTLAFALTFAALIHQLRREGGAVRKQAEALTTLSTEQEFPFYEAVGTIMHGWGLAAQGHEQEGIDQISRGLAAYHTTGAEHGRPHFLALLAEVHGKMGQTEEGLHVLTEALDLVAHNGEQYYATEMNRLQGELLLQLSSDNQIQAESCYQKALDVARHQQAKSWELRAATSLAKLWQSQDKRREPYDLLAPVYNWFQEGFDTADLKDAKALLDELS
jgi:predicted ATPase